MCCGWVGRVVDLFFVHPLFFFILMGFFCLSLSLLSLSKCVVL